MQIVYTPKAAEDLSFWVETHNKEIVYKIMQLTIAIIKNPYTGLGKPEPLKYNLSEYWSRRITQEHRYIYKITDDIIFIYSLRGHYE